jgi:hypothetical protein
VEGSKTMATKRKYYKLYTIILLVLLVLFMGIIYGKFPGKSQQSGFHPIPTVYAQVQSSDPCQSTAVPKLSIPINISATASTTQLIAAGVSTNSQIYVCGLTITISGTTTPSFQLIAGTGATCGGSTVSLTGGWLGGAASAPTPLLTGVITLVTTPPATNLCAVAGGTAPTIQGVLTFLKQPL